ncbi:MAG: acylphosphatase [Woeseiaceae bacterium]
MTGGSQTSRDQARRIRVKGRVQGVWFRDSTRREAERLGITGYARNLDDGDVEVFACGSGTALDTLCAWLQQGPPLASVTRVTVCDAEHQVMPGFTTQ